MPVSKQTRRSRHEQAENPTLKRGNPSSTEGRVGTQQFRNIPGKGLVHIVRDDTGWKELGSSQSNTSKGDKIKSTVLKGRGSSSGVASSAGTSASGTAHGGLSQLGEDDHSQYVHNTIARTVSAAHTFSGNTSFTGVPTFTNIDINGGDIATGTVINKSPVVTLAGDLGGNATFTNLGNATLTATIQPNSVALTTDTTGNYMTNVTGNSQVSVSHSQGEGSTAAFSIAGDSIGDTQLAYNTGQHLTTSSNVQFGAITSTTLDTGQGANELYAMNQNVRTTDNVQFGDIIVDGDDITSNPFSSGFTGGGWKIDNTAHAEFSSASIRGTLSVYELLLQQLRATNGSVLITAVAKVESISSNDITFEDPSDNGVCPFHTNDIVMVQRADLTGTSGADNGGGTLNIIRRIVRRVTSVSGRTITVTRDGDLPADTGSFGVGDDVVRIGNTSNTNRDAILYLSADDSKAPYLVIKDGVNSWSNWNSASTEKARLGRLDGITDTDAGLSGSQSNLYGLYSDSVYLKGHIHATSGTIGGINIVSGSLSIGSTNISDVNAYATNQDRQTFDGLIDDSPSGTGFYMDANKLGYYTSSSWKTFMAKNGDFGLAGTGGSGGGSLTWDSSTSTLSITGSITITNTGSFAPTNATNNRTDAATDTAVNSAAKTGGSIAGWSITGNAITGSTESGGSEITMQSDGNIYTDHWAINRDGSASFADNNITFATNGDITSNTFLIERTRLFGAGEDSYNGSSYVDTEITTTTRTSAYGENTYAINVSPETSSEISNGYGSRIMYRSGTKWYMQADAYFKNFTVKNGVILHTNGYRIFCNGTFTIESGATVQHNGSSVSGTGTTTGASGASEGTLKGGAAGANSGTGGAGAGSGKTGGDGGAGGGGGGMILISARYISNSGTLRATGGNGGGGENATEA
jgi:hypothetical protein